jgi:hypothetical protein
MDVGRWQLMQGFILGQVAGSVFNRWMVARSFLVKTVSYFAHGSDRDV